MGEQLRKSELETTQQTIKFFETLLHASADGIVITDAAQNIVLVNEAFCVLLGQRRRDVIETSLFVWLDQLDSGAAVRWAELEQRVHHEGDCRDVEFQIQRAGEVRHLSVNASPLNQVADEESGVIISIWRDVTERVRAESHRDATLKALRESEERYRGVAEDTPVLICRFLPAGEITFVNKTYCEYFARTPEELVGSTFLSLIPQADRETVMANISALTVESPAQPHEHRVITPDGNVRWQRWTNRALFDAQGKVFAYQSIGEDVTERKQAEEQIKQALSEKTTLLQELYHRTKNNMQVIHSMLALRALYVQDESLLTVLTDVQEKIHAMALVHQKLYESRDLSRIDLKEYIDDLAAHLVQGYQVLPERISLDLDTDSVCVLIDTAVPCGLVLSELISNALKHAFPGGAKGQISIRLHQAEDETITLEVSDNGIGVPGDLHFRTSDSLGLQTVVSIVEHQLQGQLSIETDRGVAWQIRFRDHLYSPRV